MGDNRQGAMARKRARSQGKQALPGLGGGKPSWLRQKITKLNMPAKWGRRRNPSVAPLMFIYKSICLVDAV